MFYGSYGYTDKHFGRDQHDYVTYTTPSSTSFWDSPGYNVGAVKKATITGLVRITNYQTTKY